MDIFWNQLILALHKPPFLQTTQWAETKKKVGWKPLFLAWFGEGTELELAVSEKGIFKQETYRAAALVLEREVLPRISVMYLPRGPVFADPLDPGLFERVLRDLESLAKKRRSIQIKIDPALEIGQGIPGEEDAHENPTGMAFQGLLKKRGWIFSPEQIQFWNTVLVDLQEDEEQLLERMKSKTRYNIRLSSRKGIQVRLGNSLDLDLLYRMYARTSIRGGFTIRGEDYYLPLWQAFIQNEGGEEHDPVAQPLIAEYEGEAVAGAVIFKFGDRAWYVHGMSLPEHSDRMAPHLVQWEAMLWAKSHGCRVYDMWGAPDRFAESDPMWGVYRFKSGYGGQVSRTIGAWDYSPRKNLYWLYHQVIPRILAVMRWFGNRQTGRSAAA